MLVGFTFKNFLSFKDEVCFTMEAGNLKEKENHIIKIDNTKLLKNAVIFGANGSGKSNFVKAFSKFKAIVKNSIDVEKQNKYPHEPFKLDISTAHQPTYFKIDFFNNDTFFEYSFSIAENGNIVSEELYQKESGKNKKYLFKRTEEGIQRNTRSFQEGKGLEEKTRKNALFLSVVNQFNGEIATTVYDFITSKISVLKNLDCEQRFEIISKRLLKEAKIKKEVIEILSRLDFSIQDIEIQKEEIPDEIIKKILNDENAPEELKAAIKEGIETIKTKHYFFDNKNIQGLIEFDITEESEGTKKLVYLLPILIDAINNNRIIIIDELDNSLHTLLIKNFVKKFIEKSKKSQLIFTTHDLCLLKKPEIFRRDEIWFTEKDPKFGNSSLYSLYEFKIRNDKDILKGLLAGEFGGIPLIKEIL